MNIGVSRHNTHHGHGIGSIAEEGGVEMTQERREAEELVLMEEARKAKARQTPTVTVPPYTQQV